MAKLLLLCFAASAADTKPKLRGLDTESSLKTPADGVKSVKFTPRPTPKPVTAPVVKSGPELAPPDLIELGPPEVDDPSQALTCAKLGDDMTWHAEGAIQQDCDWVAEDAFGWAGAPTPYGYESVRCAASDEEPDWPEGTKAYDACRNTCKVCGRTCDDSLTWNSWFDYKSCAWVARNAKERCGLFGNQEWNGGTHGLGAYAFTACRLACGTCDRDMELRCLGDWCGLPGICGDLPLWGSGEEQNCAWVAEAPRERCAVRDSEKVPAWSGCKRTCGTCATSCDDEPGWHKEGAEHKNCKWVGRDKQDRCDKLGEDGTLAYESCRFSCGSCDRDRERRCLDENIGCLERNGLNFYGHPHAWE